MAREGHLGAFALTWGLKDEEETAMVGAEGRAIQAERTAIGKALRWEHDLIYKQQKGGKCCWICELGSKWLQKRLGRNWVGGGREDRSLSLSGTCPVHRIARGGCQCPNQKLLWRQWDKRYELFWNPWKWLDWSKEHLLISCPVGLKPQSKQNTHRYVFNNILFCIH